jgi:hypothetical protein
VDNIASDTFIKFFVLIKYWEQIGLIKNIGFSVTLFKFKAASASGISMIADAPDYFAAPLFGLPVIGDIFDVITVSILFSITKHQVL